jgi:benzoyl-CoA reductase/2-hydroxyglutaryl-CoA dehydratase subunit BcrC/BadD/HgdB
MRRLYDNWLEVDRDRPGSGVLPGFFEYLNVPHKAVDHSIDFYKDKLQKLIGKIEAHFGVKITDQSLANSISVYNQGRDLLKKLDSLRWKADVSITGEDAMAILIASQVLPREEFNALLREFIADAEKAEPISKGKKRIMLVGSANDDIDFVKAVEASGGLVVSDTVCFGARTYRNKVSEEGNPLHALSSYYLQHSLCPRMLGFYPDRIEYIKDLVKQSHVQGAILQNVRFCDLHGSENAVIERDLEEIGIPCMRLEREYGPLAEIGRIRLRLDAFMSRLR